MSSSNHRLCSKLPAAHRVAHTLAGHTANHAIIWQMHRKKQENQNRTLSWLFWSAGIMSCTVESSSSTVSRFSCACKRASRQPVASMLGMARAQGRQLPAAWCSRVAWRGLST